jgi:hypothetical protein
MFCSSGTEGRSHRIWYEFFGWVNKTQGYMINISCGLDPGRGGGSLIRSYDCQVISVVLLYAFCSSVLLEAVGEVEKNCLTIYLLKRFQVILKGKSLYDYF